MKVEDKDPKVAAAAAVAAEEKAKGGDDAGKEKKPAPKTDEELAKIQDFVGVFAPKKKEKAEKPDESSEAEAKKKKDAEAKAKADKENKEKRPVTKPAPAAAISTEEISEAVKKGIEQGFKTQKPKTTEDEPDFELSGDDKRKISILEAMEKEYPDKYKGLSKRFADATKKGVDYADEWERKNPGKAFDAEDPEHAEFFEKNDVDWDDGHFRDSELSLAADKVAAKRVDERMKPLETEIGELKREKELARQAPKIAKVCDEASVDFWQQIGGDFEKVLSPDGKFDDAEYKAAAEKDPVGADTAIHYARVIEAGAAEIHKIFTGLSTYNPKAVPRRGATQEEAAHEEFRASLHADIGNFATRMEDEVLQMEADKQTDAKGRKFATSEEWGKLTAEQRKGRWILDGDKLIKLYTKEKAKEASSAAEQKREEIRKYSGAYAGTKPAAAAVTKSKQAGDEDDDEPIIEGRKPNSPTATTTPILSAPKGGKAAKHEDPKLGWAVS